MTGSTPPVCENCKPGNATDERKKAVDQPDCQVTRKQSQSCSPYAYNTPLENIGGRNRQGALSGSTSGECINAICGMWVNLLVSGANISQVWSEDKTSRGIVYIRELFRCHVATLLVYFSLSRQQCGALLFSIKWSWWSRTADSFRRAEQYCCWAFHSLYQSACECITHRKTCGPRG